jgi:hypothetical protein
VSLSPVAAFDFVEVPGILVSAEDVHGDEEVVENEGGFVDGVSAIFDQDLSLPGHARDVGDIEVDEPTAGEEALGNFTDLGAGVEDLLLPWGGGGEFAFVFPVEPEGFGTLEVFEVLGFGEHLGSIIEVNRRFRDSRFINCA